MNKTLSETLRLFDFPGAAVSELLRPLADAAERLERENAELAAACERTKEILDAWGPERRGYTLERLHERITAALAKRGAT